MKGPGDDVWLLLDSFHRNLSSACRHNFPQNAMISKFLLLARLQLSKLLPASSSQLYVFM
jgi:hypothetical protein